MAKQRKRIEVPEKIVEIFAEDARYRVAYGGRGSGKSWSFARMAIVKAVQKKRRILCTRELQKSIRDSVHRLISSQIEALGLSDMFEIGESFIRCKNGSEFLFKGLRHNADEIKSTEGIDICWVEEGQKTSKNSWRILTPTIRQPDSEIWVTFNPENDNDPVYELFVNNTPDNALICKINWKDNPWFADELNEERLFTKRTDPDAYDWIWDGNTRKVTDAQILAGKFISDQFSIDPKWDGPYYGADWGFAQDPTTLVECYLDGNTLYITDEAYAVGREIDDTPSLFQKMPNSQKHKIRADSARPETISYMKRVGYNIEGVPKPKGSVEDGIAYLRSLDQIVIHDRCTHTFDEARLYCYKQDRITGDILPQIVDKHNHCIDAIRYALYPMIHKKSGGGFVLL